MVKWGSTGSTGSWRAMVVRVVAERCHGAEGMTALMLVTMEEFDVAAAAADGTGKNEV